MNKKNEDVISVIDHIGDYKIDIKIDEPLKKDFKKIKEKHDIDEFSIVGNITAIGSKRIKKYIEGNGTVIIHDQKKDLILIFKFGKEEIRLIDISDAENFININKFTIKTLKELLE